MVASRSGFRTDGSGRPKCWRALEKNSMDGQTDSHPDFYAYKQQGHGTPVRFAFAQSYDGMGCKVSHLVLEVSSTINHTYGLLGGQGLVHSQHSPHIIHLQHHMKSHGHVQPCSIALLTNSPLYEIIACQH